MFSISGSPLQFYLAHEHNIDEEAFLKLIHNMAIKKFLIKPEHKYDDT